MTLAENGPWWSYHDGKRRWGDPRARVHPLAARSGPGQNYDIERGNRKIELVSDWRLLGREMTTAPDVAGVVFSLSNDPATVDHYLDLIMLTSCTIRIIAGLDCRYAVFSDLRF